MENTIKEKLERIKILMKNAQEEAKAKIKKKQAPHTDIATGKIYGCKKGSLDWWHERGHIEFNKREETSKLRLYQDYFFIAWMFSITLGILNPWMFIPAIVLFVYYVGVEIYEERWCNKYAQLNVNKRKGLKRSDVNKN